MKSKNILALSIAAIIGSAAYAPTSLAVHAPAPAIKQAAMSQSAQMKKDGAVIAILVALNTNEIAASKIALQKATNQSVKRYAKMLEREHTKNLNKILKLSKELKIASIKNSTASKITSNGKKEMSGLSAATGENFDVLFINDMVKDHQAALTLIDTNLSKNVYNTELKTDLEKTRKHIAMHLEKGQKIQKKLAHK